MVNEPLIMTHPTLSLLVGSTHVPFSNDMQEETQRTTEEQHGLRLSFRSEHLSFIRQTLRQRLQTQPPQEQSSPGEQQPPLH